VASFDTGRRLCLLFSAGGVRYGIDATVVSEVATPDPEGRSIRGFLELQDLSILLRGEPEVRPGMAVVLDVSPTLALRVREILNIADVAQDPVLRLPEGVDPELRAMVRGAIVHEQRIYLELVADALPTRSAPEAIPNLWPVHFIEDLSGQALVFESEGRLYGLPLPFVSHVIVATDAFCPLPGRSGPVAGLIPHMQALWPVYSPGRLLAGRGTPGDAEREAFFVLAEVAGRNVGLCASKVLGVHQGFNFVSAGEFSLAGMQPIVFLDLQRMFS
jgi:chemotaxis signal transduction protein